MVLKISCLIIFILLINQLIGIRVNNQKDLKANLQIKNNFNLNHRILQQNNFFINTLSFNFNNKSFPNLTLQQEIPKIFIKDEIFQLRGTLDKQASINGQTVNLIFQNIITRNQSYYSFFVKPGKKQFSLLLDMNIIQGNYTIALFIGSSGPVQSFIYKVISPSYDKQKIFSIKRERPSGFNLKVIQNKLTFNWDKNNISSLNKIVFKQSISKTNLQQISFILSNKQNIFEVPYSKFSKFIPKINVTVQLRQASSNYSGLADRNSQWSDSITIQFQPCQHHFSQINPTQLILSTPIIWKLSSKNKLILSGTALIDLQNMIIIQNSNKSFSEYYFDNQNKSTIIKQKSKIYKQIQFLISGVYIIEINNIYGQAVLNIPIYVGNIYPLIPDFNDMTIYPISISNISLIQGRNLIFNLINQKRKQWNRKPLKLSSELTIISQYHSNDMVNKNYVAHVGPDGKAPKDRAQMFNFTDNVGQNIAKNIDLTDSHLRLARSPGHLQNIVNQNWQRLGVGIAKTQNSYFILTQMFSGRDFKNSPLTQVQYQNYRLQITKLIASLNPIVRNQDIGLCKIMRQWQYLSLSIRNSITLGQYIRNKGYLNYNINNVKMTFSYNFIKQLRQSGYLKIDGMRYNIVGVSFKIQNGLIQIYAAFV